MSPESLLKSVAGGYCDGTVYEAGAFAGDCPIVYHYWCLPARQSGSMDRWVIASVGPHHSCSHCPCCYSSCGKSTLFNFHFRSSIYCKQRTYPGFQRIRLKQISAKRWSNLWSGFEPAWMWDRILPVWWYFQTRIFPKCHFYAPNDALESGWKIDHGLIVIIALLLSQLTVAANSKYLPFVDGCTDW